MEAEEKHREVLTRRRCASGPSLLVAMVFRVILKFFIGAARCHAPPELLSPHVAGNSYSHNPL